MLNIGKFSTPKINFTAKLFEILFVITVQQIFYMFEFLNQSVCFSICRSSKQKYCTVYISIRWRTLRWHLKYGVQYVRKVRQLIVSLGCVWKLSVGTKKKKLFKKTTGKKNTAEGQLDTQVTHRFLIQSMEHPLRLVPSFAKAVSS
jgi:hypothetical protein